MPAAAAAATAVKIALITGEASGDRVGGQLAAEIRALRPDAEIWGTGGQFLRDANVDVVVDTTQFGVIGIASALGLLPRIFFARERIRRALLLRRPDVIVPVDAGAFNVPLCAWTRRHLPSTRILYYFPSGSWRKHLARTNLGDGRVDQVATPFPWSERELRRLGVNATFVGHPLLDLAKPSEPTEAFAARLGLDLSRPVIGLLPGSRSQEIAEILPTLLLGAAQISARVPGAQFLLALAPTVSRKEVEAHVERVHRHFDRKYNVERAARRLDDAVNEEAAADLPPVVTNQGLVVPSHEVLKARSDWLRRIGGASAGGALPARLPLVIVENATYDVMATSDVLVTTSGTATLEAAILNKPMVIVYRLARIHGAQFAFIKKTMPPHIGLPNLILERRACPELVQDDLTPANVAQEVLALLLEPERLLKMKADLRAVVAQLGASGGARRAAEMVLALAADTHPAASPPPPTQEPRL